MKKSNFVAMILGTIGGSLFALGMCMALITEWNAFDQGVVMGAIGAVVLLIMVLVWSNMVPGIAVGIVGIVLLLCLIPLTKGLK